MKRIDTDISGVCILEPVVFSDNRGFFLESYNKKKLAEVGIQQDFVQDNYSKSSRGVVRGLHYQIGQPQAKLVRVTVGEVFDVCVDIRRGSETFGQWTGVRLSAEKKRMFFIPEGFAHGFQVLSDVAEFSYKCSDYFAPKQERGVRWDDPEIGIEWPLKGVTPVLSERDAGLPLLAEVPETDLPVMAGFLKENPNG